MKIEVGKKYTDGSSIVDIKFIDYENCAWGLDQILRSRFIEPRNVDRWQEVIDKPNPGEGWRLLEPDEDVEEGDEYFHTSIRVWLIPIESEQQKERIYRRRIAPQYVPYTWDDREELRGRWYRQKDYPEHERLVAHLEMSSNEIEVNGWGAEKFLQKCEWLDGTPCGKVVV